MSNRTISEALRASLNVVERQAMAIAGKSGQRVIVDGTISARTEGAINFGGGAEFTLVGQVRNGAWEWEPRIVPKVSTPVGEVKLPDPAAFAGKVATELHKLLPLPSLSLPSIATAVGSLLKETATVKRFPTPEEAQAAVDAKRAAGKIPSAEEAEKRNAAKGLPSPEAAQAAVDAKIADGRVKLANIVPPSEEDVPPRERPANTAAVVDASAPIPLPGRKAAQPRKKRSQKRRRAA